MHKISQLLITPPENEKSTTGIYVSEPTPLEEKNFGTIFSIVNIDSKDEANAEVINLINEELTQNYYRSTDLETETAFENTLHLLNRKLQKVIGELGEEWLKKLNLSIAVIKGNEIHFTQTGAINILLVQKNNIIKLDESSKYQSKNPLKILSNISSGQLSPNSSMIFATESILDYLSQEKIKKTLKENEPEEACHYLEELLAENSNATNFAALVLGLRPGEMPAKTPAVEAKIAPTEKLARQNLSHEPQSPADDSMTKLVSQESRTTELLSPSLWPGIKKNIKQMASKVSPIKTSPPDIKPDNSPEKLDTKEFKTPPAWLLILKKIGSFLKNAGLQIVSGIVWFFRQIAGLFKQKRKYSQSFGALPNKAGGFLNRTITWFKNLSTPRKAFMVLFIVIILVFSYSIILQGKNQEKVVSEKTYETNIDTANNKLGEADTKILMNDYQGARNLAKEASDLLAAIPKDSKLWKEKGADPQNKLQAIEDKVNYVTRISEPKSVANFSSVGSGINLSQISLISENVFGFAADNNSVYRYDMETNEAKAVVSKDAADKKFRAITKDSAATVLALLDDQSLTQFNPVLEKLSKVSAEFGDKNTNLIDLVTFGSRLYTLDIKNNQIYKNTKSGDNYGQAEEWITDEDIDLSTAKSFSIDGAIYVLKDNGEVIKLFSGAVEKEWKMETVQPGLSGSTEIYTDENSQSLYILNPSQKQVAVFDKNGKLKAQYLSDKWGDLKGMTLDEANKKLYLLNGLEVFEIDLP
ncbi:MAG: hypothetical protein WC752_03260 [Patescibacteria group bacterium]|jgi:serine/threonine protein phosphatase PrpC